MYRIAFVIVLIIDNLALFASGVIVQNAKFTQW